MRDLRLALRSRKQENVTGREQLSHFLCSLDFQVADRLTHSLNRDPILDPVRFLVYESILDQESHKAIAIAQDSMQQLQNVQVVLRMADNADVNSQCIFGYQVVGSGGVSQLRTAVPEAEVHPGMQNV